MGTRLARLLAAATRLAAKEWSSETASGWPAYSCPDCGHIAEIDPTEITDDGVVMRRRPCANEGCGFTDYLDLEAYGEGVLK